MVRYLTQNDDTTLPGVVVCVDTESIGEPDRLCERRSIHRFRLGCAVCGRVESGRMTRRKTIDFTSADSFWSWLSDVRMRDRPVWLFAHNLGFDLTMLDFWARMERGEFSLHRRWPGNLRRVRSARLRNRLKRPRKGLLVTDDPPTIVSCWHRSGWTLHCLDTLNWWEMPLARLGEMVGIDKLPMPRESAPDSDWIVYCRRDVEIVEAAVCRWALWQRSSDLGRFAFTLAGQSLAALRHRWLATGVELPDDQSRRDFERDGLFVGRLQSFWVGNSDGSPDSAAHAGARTGDLFRPPPRPPFYLLDSNSFYGAVMLETPVPHRCLECRLPGGTLACAVSDIDASCLARVALDTPHESFPVRTQHGTFFARGRFVTTLCGEELGRALAAGAVRAVYGFCRYELSHWLSDFAAGMSDLVERARGEGDRLVVYSAKAMLARLAGKFAQRTSQWRDAPEITPPGPWTTWTEVVAGLGEVRNFRSIAWDAQERRLPDDAPHSFPAVTAFVTSAGREWLRRWIESAGWEHTLYCATDALIVDKAGYERLDAAGFLHPDAMGFLKVTDCGFDLEIRGPAHYRIAGKTVIAGRDRTARMIGPHTFTATRFQTLNETLARRGVSEIAVEETVRALPLRQTPGTIRPDGWVDEPFLED